ncbi:MAG: transcriptional regulator, AraC family [Anaerocolumna sp.]|jgi:AraC-like DNA-binding protein|nr:transcriptional regulator, AraC family [Anaerocolumna sp.]
MITKDNIKHYRGLAIDEGEDYLYIPPNMLLRPYISHYCISFPTPQTMSSKYTVLPSANSVIGVFVKGGQVNCIYNGTNSQVSIVGDFANKNDLLLLIKFRAGGFYPFYSFNQDELVDFSIDLSNIDKTLASDIENGLIESKQIDALITTLDNIFLNRLKNNNIIITNAVNRLITCNGKLTTKELSTELYYCEKHIRRLFLQCIGVSTKKFSRIVRINNAVQLLKDNPTNFLRTIDNAGYYDQAHFIRDFKDIFSVTPSEFTKNMSIFYIAESI